MSSLRRTSAEARCIASIARSVTGLTPAALLSTSSVSSIPGAPDDQVTLGQGRRLGPPDRPRDLNPDQRAGHPDEIGLLSQPTAQASGFRLRHGQLHQGRGVQVNQYLSSSRALKEDLAGGGLALGHGRPRLDVQQAAGVLGGPDDPGRDQPFQRAFHVPGRDQAGDETPPVGDVHRLSLLHEIHVDAGVLAQLPDADAVRGLGRAGLGSRSRRVSLTGLL